MDIAMQSFSRESTRQSVSGEDGLSRDRIEVDTEREMDKWKTECPLNIIQLVT